MPNGKAHFSEDEMPKLEAFFSRVAEVLTQFAEGSNLKIDRYWHQIPSWRLSFRHPKGGLGCIEVMKEGSAEMRIYSYWWIDDFEKATRYSRMAETDVFTLENVKLCKLLKDSMTLVLSWQLNEWTEITTGYEQAWRSYTKEDFARFEDAYPRPNMQT